MYDNATVTFTITSVTDPAMDQGTSTSIDSFNVSTSDTESMLFVCDTGPFKGLVSQTEPLGARSYKKVVV